MMHNQTIETLRQLKLPGFIQGLEDIDRDPKLQAASFHEQLGFLADRQLHFQKNRTLAKLIKAARCKVDACPEDIDYHAARGLDPSYIRLLLELEWIDRGQPLLLIGATGLGKTWLACAFANQAARRGLSARFWRLQSFFEDMEDARADGQLRKWRMRVAKIKLIILDDWGTAEMTDERRRELLEIIDDRVEASGLIITSQLPVDQWHRYINDPTIADAILDRLVHRSHRLELRGESLRKQRSLPLPAGEVQS